MPQSVYHQPLNKLCQKAKLWGINCLLWSGSSEMLDALFREAITEVHTIHNNIGDHESIVELGLVLQIKSFES